MAHTGRTAAILGGVLVLALLAGALSEATLALGHHGRLFDDRLVRPKGSSTPAATATPTATPKPSVSSTPIPTPIPTPVPTPAGPTATTNSFVHLRSGKSTSTSILTDLNGGVVVRLLADSDAQWQQVEYAGQTGYIFKTYLTY